MAHLKNGLLALLLSFAFSSGVAKASILVEPHVAYGFLGKADYSSASLTYSGPQYGAKLGVQYFGLSAGLDYTLSNLSTSADILGTTYQANFDREQIGVFVGYKLPILLRAWFGYYFTDKLSQKETSAGIGTDGDYTKGSGTEIGVGFTGLPFLSVNLIYKNSSYDTDYSVSTGQETTSAVKQTTSEIALGVSLPLNF